MGDVVVTDVDFDRSVSAVPILGPAGNDGEEHRSRQVTHLDQILSAVHQAFRQFDPVGVDDQTESAVISSDPGHDEPVTDEFGQGRRDLGRPGSALDPTTGVQGRRFDVSGRGHPIMIVVIGCRNHPKSRCRGW